MPIRFACPYCHQKLSVSTRKAGLPADCPRCSRLLTIPPLPQESEVSHAAAEANERESAAATIAEADLTAAAIDEAPAAPPPLPAVVADVAQSAPCVVSFAEPRANPVPDQPAPAAATDTEQQQPAEAEPAAEADGGNGFSGLEIVYDAPPPRPRVLAPPAELIAVPRYVIYLQGGLLALVAFVAFVIGILAGGTLLSGRAAPSGPQACLISGSITYASGPRQLPDEGAAIAVIPQTQGRPSEKAPIEGLRPGDPTPDANHRGIAILRELGGGYARADAGGGFQVRLPSRGRYLVLVISHEKQARSLDEIDTADLLKLGPYFANAADLLGDRRYQLSQETFRGDKQLSVSFQ